MTAFTDDDVTAAEDAILFLPGDWEPRAAAIAVLTAVAPAIAARALRQAADEIERISILAQKSSDGWLRGMAAAANVVRARAEQVNGDE